jgi:hypothetical protein
LDVPSKLDDSVVSQEKEIFLNQFVTLTTLRYAGHVARMGRRGMHIRY